MKTIDEIKNIVEKTNLRHVAIIMDGNRRWAKEKKLPSMFGHQKGVEALKNTLRACNDFGIEYLTVYAFSTENWKRTPEEVNFLMELLAKTLGNELEEMHKENVKINFIGDIVNLAPSLQKILLNAQKTTAQNTGVNLQIAFNYGARNEIINAIKNISQKYSDGEIKQEDINEELISSSLYTAGMPEPDLLIRTGGEYRVSNYLLWQIAYCEFLVFEEFWPDFGRNLLADAVMIFEKRNRRYGK